MMTAINNGKIHSPSSFKAIMDEEIPLLDNAAFISYTGLSFSQSIESLDSIGDDCRDIDQDSISLLSFTRSFTRSTQSNKSVSSTLATLNEKHSDDRGSSLFLTLCNIMPILQGSTVFGIPFAVMTGGITFIPVATLLSIMAYIAGLLTVECLYEISPRSQKRKRVYTNFAEIAHACWGRFGGVLIGSLIMCSIIANNVVNVVLIGECMHNILPNHTHLNERVIMVIFSILLLPLLSIRKLSVIAYISFFGGCSIMVGSFTALVVFIQHCAEWSANKPHLPVFNADGFSLAIGIYLYSITLNSLLPPIEGSMSKPSQIAAALNFSYIFSTLFKLSFGLLGALTFGVNTRQLVVLNLFHYVVEKYVITVTLSIYSFTNSALMYLIMFQKLDDIMKTKSPTQFEVDGNFNLVWMIISRLCGVVLCTAIAMAVPHFALIFGVIGALVGTTVVLVCPFMFHLQLKWEEISTFKKVFEISALYISITIACLVTYSSANALYAVLRHG